MDKKGINVFHELRNMQCKISSLFQEISTDSNLAFSSQSMNIYMWTERNQYKIALEDLEGKIGILVENIRNLKTQNNVLKQNNVKLKSTVLNYVTLLHQMDFSKINSSQYFTSVLETFKHKILHIDKPLEKKLPLLPANSCSVVNLKENEQICIESNKLSKENSENKAEAIFLNHKPTEMHGTSSKENYWILDTQNKIKRIHVEEPASLQTIVEETFHQNSITFTPKNTEITSDVNNSSGFKSSISPKQGNIFSNDIESKRKQILNDEKNLSIAEHLFVSPLKRKFCTGHGDPLQYTSTPKRSKVESKLNSSIQFPDPHSRKSNSKEVIISNSGTKNLTQTELNVEVFKKSLETSKIIENVEGSNACYQGKVKLSIEKNEDDLIWESPKSSRISKESAIFKEESLKNLSKSQSPLSLGVTDLDETYISSEIIESNKLIDQQMFSSNGNVFSKCSIREKSPEYDSVSFVNERKFVKKKPSRIKISEPIYPDYNTNHKDVLGEKTSAKNLENSLSNCLRNKNKNFFGGENTPPGYWKPYLTATNISYSNDDSVTR